MSVGGSIVERERGGREVVGMYEANMYGGELGEVFGVYEVSWVRCLV
jgi:hypothetical protein